MILPNINIDSNGNIEEGKAYIEVKISNILAEWDKRQSEEEKIMQQQIDENIQFLRIFLRLD